MTRLAKRCGVSCERKADEDGVKGVKEGCPRKWNGPCRRRLRQHFLDNLVVGRQGGGKLHCEDKLGG